MVSKIMESRYKIFFFVIAFSCRLFAEETSDNGKNNVQWAFLSINCRNQAEVENLNKDIILTVVTGQFPSQREYVARELSLQRKTRRYREIPDCASRNKSDYSTALTRANHNLPYGLNLSGFVAGVFLPEMAIALGEGDISFFSERFEQILYILPITDVGYSFVIAPLFALIPQCAYYSNIPNDIATDTIIMVDRLLEKCGEVIEGNENIPAGRLYFMKKNAVSLETLRMNLFLMKFYQQSQFQKDWLFLVNNSFSHVPSPS